MQKSDLHVLVAPLDWGLGHATRCIPIIRELLSQGIKITLCASGGGKIILEQNFPSLEYIEIPGINIRYPQSGSMAFSMLLQLPGIVSAINREHRFLEKAVTKHKFTHVISDNRYGLFHNDLKTAFISHQVRIKTGNGLAMLEPMLFQIHKSKIEKFNELWIPDNSGSSLSGSLSDHQGISKPVKYTGILSRFKSPSLPITKTYDMIGLLSGPEPQRTLLEDKMLNYFQDSGMKCLLIRGIPGKENVNQHNNITQMNSISDEELCNVLHPETTLFCRPGYSTIMDLAMLHHLKVIFIPTPGQTEQEYLAEHLSQDYGYAYMLQSGAFPIDGIHYGASLPSENNQQLLQKTIHEFLS